MQTEIPSEVVASWIEQAHRVKNKNAKERESQNVIEKFTSWRNSACFTALKVLESIFCSIKDVLLGIDADCDLVTSALIYFTEFSSGKS